MDKVAVVLGIYKNPSFLPVSIKALQKQTYKAIDIFIYDNSEDPNTTKQIEKDFPKVKIYRNKKNNGFAGGNNTVLRDLLRTDTYKYIAILNDDTEPMSDWMAELVRAMDSNTKVGAVTSKLIYFEKFIRINGEASDLIEISYEQTKLSTSDYPKRFVREGITNFTRKEKIIVGEAKGKFSFDLPIGKTPSKKYILEFFAHSKAPTATVKLKIGKYTKSITIDQKTQKVSLEIPATEINSNTFNIVQNASSEVTSRYEGYERGNGEVDEGQYDKSEKAQMLCGAAVLIRTEALRQAGLFDEYLFMYYEDSDLNFRIKRAGWDVLYEPKAFVKHYHTFSSVEWSPLFYYYSNRNIIVFVLKNFGLKAIYIRVKYLIGETVRMSIWMLRTGFTKKAETQMLKLLIKIHFDLLFHLPAILLKRIGLLDKMK